MMIFPPKNKFLSTSKLMLTITNYSTTLSSTLESSASATMGRPTKKCRHGLWGGTGQPFGPKGKWKVRVQDTRSLCIEVHQVDFVIVCAGMYSDAPNIPEFPPEKGLKAFQGKVIHSMDYSAMDHASAAELVRGKRVAVVGFQKSGMDISMECSSANGIKQPCTLLYRTEHRNMPDHLPWGISLSYLYQTRFSELLLHKPDEGFLLSLLATLLSPLRWGVSKFVETHIKKKLRLKKHGIVPKHSFMKEVRSCSIATVPEGFFNRVEEGSIILQKAKGFSFCREGFLIDGEAQKPLKIDLLILATGFSGAQKLKPFKNSWTRKEMHSSSDSTTSIYRVLRKYCKYIHVRNDMSMVGRAS